MKLPPYNFVGYKLREAQIYDMSDVSENQDLNKNYAHFCQKYTKAGKR
jgi:hypothetical protein